MHGLMTGQSSGMIGRGRVSVTWQTVAEKTDYKKTSTYDETVAYAKRLAAASPLIVYKSYGKSGEGLVSISLEDLILLSNPPNLDVLIKHVLRRKGSWLWQGTKQVVATLQDENGANAESEKMLEIDFAAGKPARAGDQFGKGQKR